MCGMVAAVASLDAGPGSPGREGRPESPLPFCVGKGVDMDGSCQNYALAVLLLNE